MAETSDLAPVAEFLLPLGGPSFTERFPAATSQDFYRWKYFANPLGNAIVGIATASDRVVSVVAACPKRIRISANTVLAYELGDFLTDRNFRGQGLFSRLIELVCSEAITRGAALVYVRPNDVSFPILAGKLSFIEAQKMDARRFVVPSRSLSRKTGIPASMFRVTGMDALFRSRYIPRSSAGGVSVVSAERFGEETDQLWDNASAGYDFAIARDSRYLNWRFADCPTPYKIWIARRESQPAGFLVASANRENTQGAIVDLFTASSDVEAAQALLATGMGSLLDRGIPLLSTWTLQGSQESAAHNALRRAFPFRNKPPLHLAFKILAPQKVSLPVPSRKWHFTLGDSDGA